MNIPAELIGKYKDIFKEDNESVFFAPGRVNLIGEHTDYNGGYVFPCAINYGTYALGKKRNDNKIRIFSENFRNEGIIEFSTYEINKIDGSWSNYPKGVIKMFIDHGYSLDSGFDCFYFGNIPRGAGLSSSASIELSTAVMLDCFFGFKMDMIDIIKICQKAENQFVGVNCGIMDQFVTGMGKKDCGILLNCSTLEFEYSKIELDNISIVITNSKKQRDLTESKYNLRRRECEEGFYNLKNSLNINSLGDLSIEEFEENKKFIFSDIIKKRIKHVVYENHRTKEAVAALNEGDLNRFGKLMIDSHISLRDDYEVTGMELDLLFKLALNQNGVIGTRMTGAGFGGCTVSLVKDDDIESFKNDISKTYEEQVGYKPEFYIAKIGDGAKQVMI